MADSAPVPSLPSPPWPSSAPARWATASPTFAAHGRLPGASRFDVDVSPDASEKGLKQARRPTSDKGLDKGKITQEAFDATLRQHRASASTPTSPKPPPREPDLVVEAVPEKHGAQAGPTTSRRWASPRRAHRHPRERTRASLPDCRRSPPPAVPHPDRVIGHALLQPRAHHEAARGRASRSETSDDVLSKPRADHRCRVSARTVHRGQGLAGLRHQPPRSRARPRGDPHGGRRGGLARRTSTPRIEPRLPPSHGPAASLTDLVGLDVRLRHRQATCRERPSDRSSHFDPPAAAARDGRRGQARQEVRPGLLRLVEVAA